MQKEINIDKLRNDADYYGAYGKQFISNSDIGDLINNPAAFKQDTETTQPMLAGSYFEMLLLEPEKESEWTIIDASTRNTKVYKEYKVDHMLRLASAFLHTLFNCEPFSHNDLHFLSPHMLRMLFH